MINGPANNPTNSPTNDEPIIRYTSPTVERVQI